MFVVEVEVFDRCFSIVVCGVFGDLEGVVDFVEFGWGVFGKFEFEFDVLMRKSLYGVEVVGEIFFEYYLVFYIGV